MTVHDRQRVTLYQPNRGHASLGFLVSGLLFHGDRIYGYEIVE